MSYSQFTLERVQQELSLELREDRSLFADLEPCAPSAFLQQVLQEFQPLALAINSEKARSEYLTAPILTDLRRLVPNRVSLFSGKEFNVDAARGLTGFCDFVLSRSPEQFFIQVPVVTIVEAKNENIIGGLGQCAAAMVAAQIFNQQRQGGENWVIYGCVTTGSNWRFLRLTDRVLEIDREEYYIKELPQILAILSLPFRD